MTEATDSKIPNTTPPPPRDLTARIRAFLRPRNGSRSHLILPVAGTALAVLVLAGLVSRLASHPAPAPSAAMAATAAAPAPMHPAVPAPHAAAPSAASPAPVAAPTRVVQGTPITSAVTAAPATPAAGATLQPPAGVRPGFLSLTRFVMDQFGRYAQVSAATVSAQSLSVTALPGAAQAARETWAGWFKLKQAATIVEVATAGDSDTTSLSVDGTQLGTPRRRGALAQPDVLDYSLPLSAGWHRARIVIDVPARAFGTPVTLAISFGDGITTPAAAVPYAPPPSPAAPASAKAAPASASASTPAASATALAPPATKPLKMAPGSASAASVPATKLGATAAGGREH